MAWGKSSSVVVGVGGAALLAACAVDERDVGISTAANEPVGTALGGSSGSELGDAGSDARDGTAGSAGSGSTLIPGCTRASCPAAGAVTNVRCGDGVRQEDEACDDRNRVFGDGCSADCRAAEPGFSCAVPGSPCLPIARCGDGVVAATEQCDDANAFSGDGCSARCRVELGKKCQGQPSVCSDAACGDGIQEGSEGCDDGNVQGLDGCSARCTVEPACAGLTGVSCASNCGDGFVAVGEACDDGNLIDGDGCASSCTLELGFSCATAAGCEGLGGPCVLRVPSVVRDFSDTHPDFGNKACNVRAPGAVAPRLDANGRPTLDPAAAAPACLSTAANFYDWFTSNARNTTLAAEFVLFDDGAGGYVNRFGAEGQPFVFTTGQAFDGTPLFFPADGNTGMTAQFQAANIPVQYGGAVPESTLSPGAPGHNFYFSTEVVHWFQYQAQTRATLTIGADDDVWVFLNGQLALDLGGVHEPETGSLTIDAGAGLVTALLPDGVSTSTPSGDWGLAPGGIYTLGIFHAERQAPLSSLLLALSGFEAQASQCSPFCGDAVLSAGEECDDGSNDGGYGQCGVGCLLGAYCGDGILQLEFGETCDVGPGGDAGCRGCRVSAP